MAVQSGTNQGLRRVRASELIRTPITGASIDRAGHKHYSPCCATFRLCGALVRANFKTGGSSLSTAIYAPIPRPTEIVRAGARRHRGSGRQLSIDSRIAGRDAEADHQRLKALLESVRPTDEAVVDTQADRRCSTLESVVPHT